MLGWGSGMVSQQQVLEALRTVKDPELGINLVDLGLVYRVDVDPGGVVEADITLTALGCPAAPQIVAEAREAIRRVAGVREARVNLVWNPPWSPERMSERARRALGYHG